MPHDLLAQMERQLKFSVNMHQIVEQVLDEVLRQVDKWGNNRINPSSFGASDHHLGFTSDEAKAVVDKTLGLASWADIAIEELAEALDETADSLEMREELIQVAAVIISWIECIDQRRAAG